ncbi:Protein PIR [Hibiscus syriacus]|uniref:Protein PIR n=1 Tax=Hibiscus syriacus TaxID=106335 RepID=A0A6A3BCE3_HIBSY|nr:Protein PIR [Hibiscus syriacus]
MAAVPVEEAIAALSTFSLEDEQPDVQGPAVLVSTERGSTISPIEYCDVSAYRLSLTEDTKALNQLNTLIQEGKEMASVLYTYRSCVKALPQLPDSMKHNQADLYLETYQVLDLEMSRLREIQRWQASAATKLAADMQRFSRPERRINGPTITHLWSMLKLLDILVQLDHLKNAKASIPNDFSWYKRTFTQVSVQWPDTDSMREELDDLQVLIVFVIESLELDFTLLFPERHMLLRVLPVLVVLATSSEKDSELATWFITNTKDVSILKDSLISDPTIGDYCSKSRCSIIEIVSWSPPPKGFIKLNVDATVNGDWRKSGVGGILRDEDGSVMGSFQEPSGPGPPALIELLAVKRGLIFFEPFHQQMKERLLIESDSKLAVEWVKNFELCPGVYSNLVKDIVTKLRELNGIIRWVARSANVEADSLAKADLHLSPTAILKELSMYFQKFSSQTRLLTLPSPHELPPREAQEYPCTSRHYLIVNHIGTIRAEHDDFAIRFASAMNQLLLLKSTDGADIECCKEVKGNMYDMVVEGFQLLSRWTARVWEQCAWKFSRPCKDIGPSESLELSPSYSDYEKAFYFGYILFGLKCTILLPFILCWHCVRRCENSLLLCLLEIVVRYNYSAEERKALVELVSYIKSVGSMMQRSDTLIADALWEIIHAEVQDFVQNTLATMLRTTFRKKKDLSRILSDMRTLSADWMANTSKHESEFQSLQHGGPLLWDYLIAFIIIYGVWDSYFFGLFNNGVSLCRDTNVDESADHHTTANGCHTSRIGFEEVKMALRKMGRDKAVGPDQIPITVWLTLGEEGVKWLTNIFNIILETVRMPEELRESTVIPIYKNKRDTQCCGNYRGIKLLRHTMKLWERVIETRLRHVTRVSENQFGFMPGKSTTEAIHLLRRLMEKYKGKNREFHMAFIDLEKAYDSVPRDTIWKTLEKRQIPTAYIRAIRDMYCRSTTYVRTTVGDTEAFPVEIRLHKGSAFSPYIFSLIMDDIY